MRVLIAFDWFWSYVAPQAEALARRGADVGVVCRTHADEFAGDEAERQRFVQRLADNGVDVFEVPGRVRSPSGVAATIRLRRRIRSWRPDIVHAHDNCDPRLLSVVAGIPRVLTVHDPTPHPGASELRGVRAAIRKRWVTGSVCLVVHGETLLDRLAMREPRARIVVVPHGARVDEAPMAVPADPPTLLLFGRREQYKGLGLLQEAMQRVWLRRPDTRLMIAGRGSEALTGLNDRRVEIRDGYIPESDLDELFGRARLVVLPYIEASQSGVALQALGRGVPVVATAVGAIPDVVPSEEFLAAPQDPRSFADRVLQWLEHPPTVRTTVLEWTRARSSWDAVAERSLELYRSVSGAAS